MTAPPTLVVHLGGGPPRGAARTEGTERHLRVSRWPRPGPLPGADLVVTHGLTALLIGVPRARRHRVPIEYRATGDDRITDLAARVLRTPAVDASIGAIVSTPPARGRHQPGLHDRLHLLAAAERSAGAGLLVTGPEPDQPVLELTGSGPRIWLAFGNGATVGDVIEDLVADTGAGRHEVGQGVLDLTASLLDAGLAELR